MTLRKNGRYTMTAKTIAFGFMLSVLFGNFLLILIVLQSPIPDWLLASFYCGTVISIIGGISFICQAFYAWIKSLSPKS